jgi:hypothetical protein
LKLTKKNMETLEKDLRSYNSVKAAASGIEGFTGHFSGKVSGTATQEKG